MGVGIVVEVGGRGLRWGNGGLGGLVVCNEVWDDMGGVGKDLE